MLLYHPVCNRLFHRAAKAKPVPDPQHSARLPIGQSQLDALTSHCGASGSVYDARLSFACRA